MTKSPSGGLSPYYYKGGYFHGIHYGSFFSDETAFLSIMKEEEAFILKSPQRRRIMMDFYETKLSKRIIEKIIQHIEQLKPRIIKLAISSDKKSLRILKKAIKRAKVIGKGMVFFSTDMEEGKTWLISD